MRSSDFSTYDVLRRRPRADVKGSEQQLRRQRRPCSYSGVLQRYRDRATRFRHTVRASCNIDLGSLIHKQSNRGGKKWLV